MLHRLILQTQSFYFQFISVFYRVRKFSKLSKHLRLLLDHVDGSVSQESILDLPLKVYTFISPRTLPWISSDNPIVILFAVLGKSWRCCLHIANPSRFWSTSSLESKLSLLTISVFSKSFRLFYPWWLYRWCHNFSVSDLPIQKVSSGTVVFSF